LQRQRIHELAAQCGFDLTGVAAARLVFDFATYQQWVAAGRAGAMRYLTDHRATLRNDPRQLLDTARSVICVGKLYNGPEPYSNQFSIKDLGWISRYAWGEDYHPLLRSGLLSLADSIRAETPGGFDFRICVDTAPLLERSLARQAGLGWIGKNTCLIHEGMGSWFFLGELLLSLEIEPDSPPPDRCGTCRRCIDACPTAAIVPSGGWWTIDSRLCISYFTIELRDSIPEEHRPGMGPHVFGCDICQDVCPWNRRAPADSDPAFRPRHFAPPLEKLAALSEQEFKEMFRGTPVTRARYAGFLRNVAVAMGNAGLEKFRAPLRKLATHPDALVAEHARWALERLQYFAS
jgi:epoxyqueuosine reductase